MFKCVAFLKSVIVEAGSTSINYKNDCEMTNSSVIIVSSPNYVSELSRPPCIRNGLHVH